MSKKTYSYNKSKKKTTNKTKSKAWKITVAVIVVLAIVVVFSPLFLPEKKAAEVENRVVKIVGEDSVLGKGYRKLLVLLRGSKQEKQKEQPAIVSEAEKPADETAKAEQKPAETKTSDTRLSSNRIEGLEIPAYVGNHEVVRHTGYTLSWNETYLVADWVAYELTAEELDTKEVSRSEDFRPDPSVKRSSQLEDYKNSGYSRGHLAPAQDFKWSANAMSETFYLTNMVPQKQNYNGGIWLKAENATRDAARITGIVYVVTGPVLTDGPFETIGPNNVAIPKQCYKALLVIDENGEVHTIALSIPQEGIGKKEALSKFVMTVDELEELTGLDFFCELDDAIENVVEATYDIEYWPNSFR